MFPICEVHLWNRTVSKANELKQELESLSSTFGNKEIKIFVHDSIGDCVKTADIIVTATHATTPVLFDDMLKENVHINGNSAIRIHIVTTVKIIFLFEHTAVGASKDHHSEIDFGVYKKSKIYIDSWNGAKNELKTLDCPVEGEVGELINKSKVVTKHPRTIFHSLGMAVVDAAVAQVVESLYQKKYFN